MVKNEDGTITITKDELKEFINNTEAAKSYLNDIYELRDIILGVCSAFKITTPDGKKIRPSILDKTENPIKSLAKGGIAYLGNMTMAAAGMKSAIDEIEKNFGFISKLGPMMTKYGGHGEQVIIQKQISE